MLGHAEHDRAGACRTDHQAVVADKGHALADQMQGQGGLAHARKPGHGHARFAHRDSCGMRQKTTFAQFALDEAVVDEIDDLVGIGLAVPNGQILPFPEKKMHAGQALANDPPASDVDPFFIGVLRGS